MTSRWLKELPEVMAAPSAPTDIMADISEDKSSITVSWTAPTANPPLTGYTITKTYMKDGAEAMVEENG